GEATSLYADAINLLISRHLKYSRIITICYIIINITLDLVANREYIISPIVMGKSKDDYISWSTLAKKRPLIERGRDIEKMRERQIWNEGFTLNGVLYSRSNGVAINLIVRRIQEMEGEDVFKDNRNVEDDGYK
ncbi:unnamed protein product, partial [Dovyalis caffra]